MKIIPTLEGGLAIEPETDIDWEVLGMIASDIGRPGQLAEHLASLMDDESEWDEWVVPELVRSYDDQMSLVSAAVHQGRLHEGKVLISPGHADPWYGALNQARLALQSRYRLDSLEKLDTLESTPDEVVQAHFRDRFYASLQSLILEFVLDPGGDPDPED
ncbi:hypothetical protein HW115_17030 [Verrucomicrobiaceae bacterium N1E253]|uniref:Uncharacterized protein n=1 Tax=Oceaniferula marina TaxID=2748318 RepID=A0A851GQR0_9BACT|nr:hypothetical protein [Oceaniferula marina]NWK57327.1 hypothetical protein [Oceaniferula marina]